MGSHLFLFLIKFVTSQHRCRKCKLMTIDFEITLQSSFFPFFQVSHHTKPRAMSSRLKHQLIIGRCSRLHQKNLDESTCILTEVHTRLNDTSIVKYHQSSFRKMRRKMMKDILGNLTMLIKKEFGMITLRKWKFCYFLIRKIIIEI